MTITEMYNVLNVNKAYINIITCMIRCQRMFRKTDLPRAVLTSRCRCNVRGKSGEHPAGLLWSLAVNQDPAGVKRMNSVNPVE